MRIPLSLGRFILGLLEEVHIHARPASSRAWGANTFLVLENHGPAVAEEVDMQFAGDGWDLLEPAPQLPITLYAEQRFPIQVVVTHPAAPTLNVDLRWVDGRGSQAKTMTISR